MKKYLLILLTPFFALTSCDKKNAVNDSLSQNESRPVEVTADDYNQLLYKKELDLNCFLYIYKISATSFDESFHDGYIFELYQNYFIVKNDKKSTYYSLNYFGFKLITSSENNGIQFTCNSKL